MKSKEELNTLKEEVKALNKKLAELNEDELEQVAGGFPDRGECMFKDYCCGFGGCMDKSYRENHSNCPYPTLD